MNASHCPQIARRTVFNSPCLGACILLILQPAFFASAGAATVPSTQPDAPTAAAAGSAAEAPDPFPPATPKNVVSVTHQLFPAVVRIDVARPSYADGRRSVERGIGSGVIIDRQGHILTNFHVAGRATEIHITLYGKERVKGTLIGDDHWTDLAGVQMDMDEIRQKKIDFTFATLGDSSTVVPGQDVMAIGTPFGLARTLTLGTVSNVERTLYPDQLKIDDEYETGDYSNWIQMDVPINPGNSGGPLVDLAGKVVGINTRGGAQNLNFAIPINTAKPVIQSILASATPGKIGHVERADLGMDFKPMQDLEAFYNLDPNQGVLVNDVRHFSAAQEAGVEPQDVLLAINDQPTDVRFPEELAPLRQMIAMLPIGKSVMLKLQRSGKIIELPAAPKRLIGSIGEETLAEDWGVSVREVTPDFAASQQLSAVTGVTVTSVMPDSAGAKAGLGIGDVIEEVDTAPIADLAAFEREYGKAHDAHLTQVMMSIGHNQGHRLALLAIDPSSNTSGNPLGNSPAASAAK
jgi:serine protease Do